MELRSFLLVLLFQVAALRAQYSFDVLDGSQVSLQCRTNQDTTRVPTKYVWTDPRDNVRSRDVNLLIPNFSGQDEGTYTCTSTETINGVDQVVKKMVNVRIKGRADAARQRFLVSVPKTYDTFVSGIILIACKAPGPNEWEYEFKWTSPTGRTFHSSSLFKNKVNFDDSGLYVCSVKRKADGAVTEGYTSVTVNSLPMKIEKVSGVLRTGETVRLKCEIDETETAMKLYERYSYVWTDPQNRVVSYDKIVEIKLEDPSKFGRYQCKAATTSMDPPYSQTQEVELRYTTDSKRGMFERRIESDSERRVAVTYVGRFTSNPYKVRYFSPLELTCNVNPALLDVSYKIFFNDKLVTTSNLYTIPRLGTEHLGIYQCHITGRDTNSKELITLKTTFTIEAEYNVMYKIDLAPAPGPQLFVRSGDKRELYCEAPANSALQGRDASWYFNGVYMTPADFLKYSANIQSGGAGSSLVLKQIQSLNEGKYECSFLGIKKEAYILVISDVKGAVFQASVAPVHDAFINEEIRLSCKASFGTDSDYVIDWMTPKGVVHRNSLFLTSQASFDDSGLYKCRVRRKSDGASSEGYTMVTIHPLPLMVVQQSGVLKVGSTVRLLCEMDKSKTNQKIRSNYKYMWTDPSKRVLSDQQVVDIRLDSEANMGKYQCKVTSTNTNAPYSQIKEIELKATPDMEGRTQNLKGNLETKYVGRFESDKKTPRYFDSLRLLCDVNPPLFDVSYRISFNDQILTTSNTYTIPRLGKEHLGVYQCNIRGINVLTREVIQLHPTFVLQPNLSKDVKIELVPLPGIQAFVQTGDKKELFCETSSSSGSHGKEATWSFNGREVTKDDFGKYNVDIQSSNHGSTMLLKNPQIGNEGKYECKARGVTKAAHVFIIQGNERQSYGVSVPPSYDTFASGMIYLLCKSAEGNDDRYEFQWTTPTGNIQKAASFYKNQVGHYDSGRYVCRMRRKTDNAVLESSTLVSVHPLPMKIEKVGGSLLMGETVRLKCDVDKSKTDGKVLSDYIYTWTDPLNKVVSNDPVVDIKLEGQSNFGKYQCKATSTNMVPVYSQIREIELKVIPGSDTGGRSVGDHGIKAYTSHFVSNPQDLRFYGPVELICSVNPFLSDVSYQIFFKNQLLSTASSYRIPQLTTDHLGVYQCHITGRDAASGINIKLMTEFKILSHYTKTYRIVLVQSPGPQIFVKTGEKRELYCEVPPDRGLHGRDAIWYFNGRDISPNDLQRYNIQVLPSAAGSTIVLNDIQSPNEGKYECRVRGEMKEAYILVMSGAKERPFRASVPNKYDTFVSGVILLVCKASAGSDGDYEYQWISSTGRIQQGSAFHATQVGLHDHGMYTCRITRKSDGVVSEGYTTVLVNPLPIRIERVSGDLQMGDTVKLKCEIDTSRTDNKVLANYRYSWTDPAKRVISLGQLVDIKLGDPFSFGTYQCKAESVGMEPPYSQIQEIELRVSQDARAGGSRTAADQLGTTYVGHFNSSQETFRYSDSLELNCGVSPALANATYEILFNNQLLTRSSRHTIRRLEKENLGVYQCNILGRDARSGNIVHLRISYVIQPDQGRAPQAGQARPPARVSAPAAYDTFASGMIFLYCKSAEGGDEDYEFQWRTPAGSVQKASSFYKSQVAFADAGRYTCAMTRKADGAVSEAHTTVTVSPLPLKIERVSGALRQGDTLRLRCEIDALRAAHKAGARYAYSWLDPAGRVISRDRLVDIPLGEPASFGRYRCRVASADPVAAAAGDAPYSQTQDIEVRYVPQEARGADTAYTARFDTSPGRVRFFEPLSLRCSVQPALADATYQISRNERVLAAAAAYTIARLDTASLGVYRCFVSGRDPSTGQTVSLQATFTIQADYRSSAKIELSQAPGPQIFARTGDKKELHCEIPTDSGLHGRDAIWYFNGREISPNDVIRYNIFILQRMSVSIMVLKNIQYPNEGKYECRIRGQSKEAYVLVMASSVLPQQTIEAAPGSLVHLQCKSDSKNNKFPTTYEWVDPSNQVRGSNMDLFIPNFSQQDQGRYTCRTIQNRYGVDSKREMAFFVKLKGSPDIQTQTSSVMVPQRHDAVVGGVLYLLCNTSNDKDENYEFSWITPNGNILPTFRLYKDQVGYEDSGRYVCRMKRRSDGLTMEGYTMVTINPLPIKITKVSGTLSMGEATKLKCEIDKSQIKNQMFTNYIYSWLDPTGKVISNDPFVDVRLDGPSSFGRYQCRVTSVNMNPPYSQVLEIEIRASQDSSNMGRAKQDKVMTAYTGSLDSNKDTFKYSDPLELTCSVSPPLSDVSYEIYFNGQFLTRGNSYRISRIGREHLGVYECNINGRDVSSGGMVHLKATYTIRPDYGKGSRIELIRPPGPEVTVRPGETRELYCEVAANSGLNGRDATWFFNSKEITNNDHATYKIQVYPTTTGSFVVLRDAQPINRGKYECRVRGEVKEAYVLVLPASDKKPHKVSVPMTYDVFPGGMINLQCGTTDGNDGRYEFQWSLPNGNIHRSSTFYKSPVGFQDAGRYVCRVTRRSDGTASEGYTIVTISPLPMEIEKASGNVRTGETVRLKCGIDKSRANQNLFPSYSYSWIDPSNRVISNDAVVDVRLDGPSSFGRYQCRVTSVNMNPPYSQVLEIEIRASQDSSNMGRAKQDKVMTAYTGSLDSNKDTFKYSDPLELTCSVSPPLSDVSYEIYFNGQFLARGNSYRISRIGREHLGVYECNINGRDASSGGMVHLKATYTIRSDYGKGSRIELIRPPGPEVTVRPGETRELYCEVPANSGLNGRDATWFFNSKEITNNDHATYKIQVYPTTTGSFVVLRDVQPINRGKYECRVRGEVKEVYIFVSLGIMEKSYKVSVPMTYDAFPGGMINLQCRTTDGNDEQYEFQWSLPNGSSHLASSLYKSPIGAQDAGLYACRVKRKSDGTVSEGHTIVTISALPLEIDKTSGYLEIGDSLKLQCGIDRSRVKHSTIPTYSYSWTDPSNNVISNSQVANVRVQGTPTTGRYQCKISTVNVYPPYSQIREVEVKCLPHFRDSDWRSTGKRPTMPYKIEFGSSTGVIRYGSRAELVCNVSPPLSSVTYQIYLNNRLLINANTYTIPQFGKANHGVYKCAVSGRDLFTNQILSMSSSLTIPMGQWTNSNRRLARHIRDSGRETREYYCETFEI